MHTQPFRRQVVLSMSQPGAMPPLPELVQIRSKLGKRSELSPRPRSGSGADSMASILTPASLTPAISPAPSGTASAHRCKLVPNYTGPLPSPVFHRM